MGNLGVPELLIIVAVLAIAGGITLAVRASRKKRAQYPPHFPPPYGQQYPPQQYTQQQYPPQGYPPQQYPPQGPPPQGPHPPRQGPWQ